MAILTDTAAPLLVGVEPPMHIAELDVNRGLAHQDRLLPHLRRHQHLPLLHRLVLHLVATITTVVLHGLMPTRNVAKLVIKAQTRSVQLEPIAMPTLRTVQWYSMDQLLHLHRLQTPLHLYPQHQLLPRPLLLLVTILV